MIIYEVQKEAAQPDDRFSCLAGLLGQLLQPCLD